MANILKVVLTTAQARVARYSQKAFARDLTRIAQALHLKGYTEGSVSSKLKRDDLRSHLKYEDIIVVLEEFCREQSIDFTELQTGEQSSKLTSISSSNREQELDGAWQHLMLQNIRDVKGKLSRPSVRVRRSLFICDAATRTFRILGNTTDWRGQVRFKGTHIYLQGETEDQAEEVFMIFQHRHPRALREYPLHHCGLQLGVALGKNDHPNFPIVAGRCVLRKLGLLSNILGRTPISATIMNNLRRDYCGYVDQTVMLRKDINFDKFSQVHDDKKSLVEQYYSIARLLSLLSEDEFKGNVGTRIFLR